MGAEALHFATSCLTWFVSLRNWFSKSCAIQTSTPGRPENGVSIAERRFQFEGQCAGLPFRGGTTAMKPVARFRGLATVSPLGACELGWLRASAPGATRLTAPDVASGRVCSARDFSRRERMCGGALIVRLHADTKWCGEPQQTQRPRLCQIVILHASMTCGSR